MMPILEQSPAHHHHGHGHQAYYHQQHSPEQNGKIQLTLILPNGVPSVINVDANTPMMDLLVHAASLNKLNPSSYSLVVLDSNQHVIHFKANQTVGQIVRNCRLPQINGSSTISLLPKEPVHSNSTNKPNSQPFEITVRLLVNLPDAQKILLRVDPTLPLYEIKEQICKQKKYTQSNKYTLRLPSKLDQPLLLGLSLAEYKTNELTLVYHKDSQFDHQSPSNEHQSFDRLYRTRSETQPPKETVQEVAVTEHQESPRKQDRLVNTIRPSHTSLHAYWNDPNFDTQSQISNSSSTTKKRRAPKPPGHFCPNRTEPQIVYIHQQQQPLMQACSPSQPLRIEHHQSQESLQAENTKKKRKAPVMTIVNTVEKQDETEQHHNVTIETTRPTLEPPPPPSSKIDNFDEDLHKTPVVEQQLTEQTPRNDVSKQDSTQMQTPTLEIQTNSQPTTVEIHSSPVSNHSPEQVQVETAYSTPLIIDPQEEKKSEEEVTPPKIEPTVELEVVKTPTASSPMPKPPRQTPQKEKKSSTIDGLLRIIHDHTERGNNYQQNEKQEKETNENVSYFRVAKSRYGKFETDNRGFVHNSIAIFDSTNQQKFGQPAAKVSHPVEGTKTTIVHHKSTPAVVQAPSKGKQAYNLLRKYEKEDETQSMVPREKSPTPIQLEVTERTTHITVTVESDRKQLITRASPVAQQPTPPIVAPKPVGKTITEYRTIRRIGNVGGETNATMTTTTKDVVNRRLSSIENEDRLSNHSGASHEELMESIRRFGGSQNLGKK
ncbi:unnamed protein product [Adineta ricciae]|uniref:Cordon-bleu ubiquitin-like domain-containing protein n=1 Tax=Adineta ricciae TaxID=249248 RepID=A0A813WCC4_ADIRI|nr:unnamed protein product [Adineta ricciae]